MDKETGIFLISGYPDKGIKISNETLGIFMEVDYDDVNHYEIDEFVKLIVAGLNRVTEDEWILARFKAKKIQKQEQMEDLGY